MEQQVEQVEQQTGFFYHVHHETLLEWCYNYNERAEYIRTGKPEKEREIRLRLFKPVKGNLPQEVVKARKALDAAWQVFIETRQNFNAALIKVGKLIYGLELLQNRDEARQASEAYQTHETARYAYDEALRVYNESIERNMSEIELLHSQECPNCPWNGHTIFPAA